MLQSHAVLTICVASGITSGHFHEYRHQEIYRAIQQLWAVSQDDTINFNFSIVTPKLRDMGVLDKVGGSGYVCEVGTYLPTAQLTRKHVEDLIEKHTLRKAIAAFQAGARACILADAKPIEIISETTAALQEVAAKKEIRSCTDDAFTELDRMIDERTNGNEFSPPLGMPTAIPGWDGPLKGIFPAEMYIIASAPGGGKTSLLEQMAEIQIETGNNVLVVQKDMNVVTMLGRMAARRAHTSYSKFKTGHATSGSLEAIREAVEELKQFKHRLHIYNPEGLTPDGLDALVRSEKQRHDIKAFYLDHFFQLRFPGKAMMHERSMEGSIVIRRTITETGVPGIILVHVTREAQKAKKPLTANDVKYCEQLHGDCDAMGMLGSDQDPSELQPGELQEVYLSWVKYRTGAISKEPMHFDRTRCKFIAI